MLCNTCKSAFPTTTSVLEIEMDVASREYFNGTGNTGLQVRLQAVP